MTGERHLRLYDMDPDETSGTTRRRPAREHAMPSTVAETIGSGLGQVVVGLTGRLLAVDLDQSLARGLRADRLGELVTEAVNRAESRARNRLREKGERS